MFCGSPLPPLPEQRGDLPGGAPPISQGSPMARVRPTRSSRSMSGTGEQMRRDPPISQERSVSGAGEQMRRDGAPRPALNIYLPLDISSDEELNFKRCTVHPGP